jgi:hypothetical protein
VDSVGAQQIVEQLEDLKDRFVGRFEPAGILLDAASARRSFY